VRVPNFTGKPARPQVVSGPIRNTVYEMYDLTNEQYKALAHLTNALVKLFPKITLDYPRNSSGQLLLRTLTPDEFAGYHGLLGHWHVQTDKIDPGPAFDWDRLLTESLQVPSGARTNVWQVLVYTLGGVCLFMVLVMSVAIWRFIIRVKREGKEENDHLIHTVH